MKYALALLLFASVARADSVPDVTTYDVVGHTSCKNFSKADCTRMKITGSYELDQYGEIVGPWSFSSSAFGVIASGTDSNQGCFTPGIVQGCAGFSAFPFPTVSFEEGVVNVSTNYDYIDSWIGFTPGAGKISGDLYNINCFQGIKCGLESDGAAEFTGFARVDHNYDWALDDRKSTILTPEPSSLLLLCMGLLGFAVVVKLHRHRCIYESCKKRGEV